PARTPRDRRGHCAGRDVRPFGCPRWRAHSSDPPRPRARARCAAAARSARLHSLPAPSAAHDALALLAEQHFPAEPAGRRDALVHETLRTLAEPDAGVAVHALLDRAARAALVVALSPDALRGALVALSPAGASTAPDALAPLLERALATWP